MGLNEERLGNILMWMLLAACVAIGVEIGYLVWG